MDSDERRKNTRVDFYTTVDVAFPEASYTACKTENLSTKGLFVKDILGRSLGDSCSLTLMLAGTASNLSLSIGGEVVRVTADGIGIHFKEMDIDSFSHLRKIVYYNCDDPDKIDEDFVVSSR